LEKREEQVKLGSEGLGGKREGVGDRRQRNGPKNVCTYE
jgi:hypothetical protein